MKKKGYEKNIRGEGGGPRGGGRHNDDERDIERGDAEAESMTKVQFFFRGLILSMYMIYM